MCLYGNLSFADFPLGLLRNFTILVLRIKIFLMITFIYQRKTYILLKYVFIILSIMSFFSVLLF